MDSVPEDDRPEPRNTSVGPPAQEKSLTPEAEDCRGNSQPTGNVEAAADKMMPELKDDLSSSEQSVPRSPNKEKELGEVVEPDEAVEIDPEQEQLKHDVMDAEYPPSLLLEIEDDRGQLVTTYQNYQATELRISAIKRQLEAFNDLWIFLLLPMHLILIRALKCTVLTFEASYDQNYAANQNIHVTSRLA